MIDRFGSLPPEVDNLLATVAIKQLCKEAGVSRVEAGPKGAVISFHNDRFANVDKLVAFITSGPVLALAIEGESAISVVRTMMGATNPANSAPGTIRGDLAVNIGRNVIHGSDAPETAQFEIGLWFQPSELSDWTPADQTWRTEG